ncbi:hypothetical protein JNUCC0626_05415 [Lentzea sp. JNUCC 0626]|uniref:hypothetical protein n=1 Tax=Lentzea sp. JNUCC 0626 TaxID=3367513 RepID=UPI0037486EA9
MDARKKTLRLVAFAIAAIVVVGGVGFGVNYAWQASRGPTQASKEDCDLAQQLIDRAGGMPSGAEEAKALDEEIRKIRYAQFENDGISTEVGRFVSWKLVKVTGEGSVPTREKYEEMVSNAQGHCRGERDLVIPGYAF